MRPAKLLLTLLCWWGAVGSAHAFTLWNDFRASALLPDESVLVREENPQVPGSAANASNAADASGSARTPRRNCSA